MDLHMSDTKRALEDDGDQAETNNMNDDPFLSLIRSEQSSAPVNFSRPRKYQSETVKSRLKLESLDTNRLSFKRLSDTTPSESTDNTWATATSQQSPAVTEQIPPPVANNISSTDDDTITLNLISQPPPNPVYPDETPTSETVPPPKSTQTAPRQKESPISQTTSNSNPGSLWDELDLIKRRLRQLELNHPSVLADRPQTRGTTNSSSSPQRSSPFQSQAGTSITSTSSPPSYPLLNAAITKIKASGLSIDIAQAIEATAQEAISLALMTTHDPSAQPPSPRAIRKKVDGVCRGLTEVCLALADHQQLNQRQQTRAAQHRAEDAQDSSPLSTSGRQSMTLSRTTARRLSGGTNISRTSTVSARVRRPAHSVVGMSGEDLEEDAGNVTSRPSITRYSTIQYRPPSRATTEVYRDTTPPVSTIQRFSSNRRSLLSRHGPSMSDFRLPSDTESPHEDGPAPTPRSATFAPSSDDRRRSLNLPAYFSSPPRPRTEFSRESGLPTPSRPVSLISPPRVNVGANSLERRDSTIRRRPKNNADKPYVTDADDDRSSILARSNTDRRSLVGSDIRRHESLRTRNYAESGMESQ